MESGARNVLGSGGCGISRLQEPSTQQSRWRSLGWGVGGTLQEGLPPAFSQEPEPMEGARQGDGKPH